MPVTFRILPDHALVLVSYEGVTTMRESFSCFEAYLAHPDHDPNQRHLIDLSRLDDMRMDYPTMFLFQARKAEIFMAAERPVTMVYLAPNDSTLRLARRLQRSWDGLDGAIARIAIDWPGAMDILGLQRTALDDVLSREA
jgi:hypothetical protein